MLIMIGMGAAPEDVAHEIGITRATLRKHYKPEITFGRARFETKLRFRGGVQALKGVTAPMIFMLKARCGFREAGEPERAPVAALPPGASSISSVDPTEAARAYLRLIEGKE